MLRGLASLAFWAFLVVSSVALFPVAVLIWAGTAPFDRRRVLLHRFTCFWASLYSWLNPAWRVQVSGREHLHPDETCVLVVNHQSLVDILVLFRLFTHFKWVSKIENFRLPFIGWNMSLNRYIKLRRGDRKSVVQMMQRCRETLAEGSSLMFFPEGTRSQNGRLRAFKSGAFELAQQARVPIVPIILTGSGDALPKRGFVLRGRSEIRLRVLEPIPWSEFRDEPTDALTARMRELFARELGEAPRLARSARG